MTRIIAWTAQEFSIQDSWRSLFRKARGNRDVSDARTTAMCVAMAAGIPTRTVAKVFNRTWAAVDSARQTGMGQCDRDMFVRDRFVTIFVRSLDSNLPYPILSNQ